MLFIRSAGRPRCLRTWSAAAVLTAGIVAVSLLTSTATPVSAAPVAQCNAIQNSGGEGLRCTVVVANYVTATGALSASPPSTVTMTKCVGTKAEIIGGGGTCTTTTTTSTAPVTTVQQCNVSGFFAGAVICRAVILNLFASAPASPIVPATVYQCVGPCTTTTTSTSTCQGACTATTTTVCDGACLSSLVRAASSNPSRVVPRPAATGMGVAEESVPLVLLVGLMLAAGTLTGLGAYAVRHRRP